MASEKCVLITGAGSGIGKAAAERFARGGARVIVHDFRDAGRQVADSLGASYVDGDLSAFSRQRCGDRRCAVVRSASVVRAGGGDEAILSVTKVSGSREPDCTGRVVVPGTCGGVWACTAL